MAVDTDMVGPFGYGADISRTWLVGDRPPTGDQRDRYQRAHAEITHTARILAPGRTFKDVSDKAFRQPDEFIAHRYACVAHGVGMTDEYPRIAYRQDWPELGYDGELVPGAVISVESFVGSEHGGPGVKLEGHVPHHRHRGPNACRPTPSRRSCCRERHNPHHHPRLTGRRHRRPVTASGAGRHLRARQSG